MGCIESTSRLSFTPAADLIGDTKHYFGLGDYPCTMKATAKGNLLDVRLAGLDQSGMLCASMNAFTENHFWITYASVYAIHGLFNAKFELSEARSIKEQRVLGMQEENGSGDMQEEQLLPELAESLSNVEIFPLGDQGMDSVDINPQQQQQQQLSVGICLDYVQDVRADTKVHIQKFDSLSSSEGAVLRLTISREFGPFIRVALFKTVQAAGLKIIVAALSTRRHRGLHMIQDTLWLGINEDADMLADGFRSESSSPGLSSCNDLIQKLKSAASEHSPTKFYAAQTTLAEATRDMKVLARRVSKNRLEAVPQALLSKARDLPYKLHLDRQEGMQFSGIDKYFGIGMRQTHSDAHVLEFSTYFTPTQSMNSDVSDKKSVYRLTSSTFSSLFGRDNKCSEFVTQYNTAKNSLTILKVFLNGLLPARQRIGARVVAEQMLHQSVPDIIKGGEWNAWAAISQLCEMRLCDVVNWNTYALLSMAGRRPESDLERWLVNQEAAASGLTLQDLEKQTVMGVFPATPLGKLTQTILTQWENVGVAFKKIANVSLHFERSGQMEFIHGEYRRVMDVVVMLDDNDLCCLAL